MNAPYSNFEFPQDKKSSGIFDDHIDHVDVSDSSCSCLHPIYKVITKKECTTVRHIPQSFYKVRKEEFSKESREHFNVIRVDHSLPILNFNKYVAVYVDDLRKPSVYCIALPCGCCSECLNRITNRWSMRLKLDIERPQIRAYFVTLTYSPDKRCHTIYNVNHDTGEIYTRKNYRKLPYLVREIRSARLPFGQYINTKDYPFLTEEMEEQVESQLSKEYYVDDTTLFIPSGFTGVVNFNCGYNGNNLPTWECNEDSIKGELKEFSSSHGYLNYSDVQKFFKRVRRTLYYYYGISELKYFLCGEYSPAPHLGKDGKMTEGFLPHYHMLLWFKDTNKSNCGWTQPKPRRNKRVPSFKIFGRHLFSDGRCFIPPLTDFTLNQLVFHEWGLCDYKGFNMSRCRSTEASARYISKYILKAVTAKHSSNFVDDLKAGIDSNAKYYDEGQQLYAPFQRHMSKGIAKSYCINNSAFLATNLRFYFMDGPYLRFYPSIMLKWIYSAYDKEGNKIEEFYENDNYFKMLRKREHFMSKLAPKSDKSIEDTARKLRYKTAEMFDQD